MYSRKKNVVRSSHLQILFRQPQCGVVPFPTTSHSRRLPPASPLCKTSALLPAIFVFTIYTI
jgi:hypothetical protein